MITAITGAVAGRVKPGAVCAFVARGAGLSVLAPAHYGVGR